jgi:hypothetical protein
VAVARGLTTKRSQPRVARRSRPWSHSPSRNNSEQRGLAVGCARVTAPR